MFRCATVTSCRWRSTPARRICSTLAQANGSDVSVFFPGYRCQIFNDVVQLVDVDVVATAQMHADFILLDTMFEQEACRDSEFGALCEFSHDAVRLRR